MISPAACDVQRAVLSQDWKWGEQDHAPEMWLAIIARKVGEANGMMLDARAGAISWDHYRMAMIETAAAIVAAVECYDRQAALFKALEIAAWEESNHEG